MARNGQTEMAASSEVNVWNGEAHRANNSQLLRPTDKYDSTKRELQLGSGSSDSPEARPVRARMPRQPLKSLRRF